MYTKINAENRDFIDLVRGASIFRVVLAHLGLLWFLPPYSQYIGAFLCVLFFISGAVGFQSFLNSESSLRYLSRRLVLTVVPFYVFAALVFLLSFFWGGWNEFGFLRWFLLWPDQSKVFFPIGQIWFINALVVMIILSFPIFLLSRKSVVPLLVASFFSLALVFSDFFFPVKEGLINHGFFQKINWSWQAWATFGLISFYLLGAAYFCKWGEISRIWAFGISLVSFFLAAVFVIIFEYTVYFSEHVVERNLVYVSVSMGAVFLLIGLRPFVVWMGQFRFLRWFLLFFNRYAYMIFLSHTLVLFFVEEALGWQDLSGDYVKALARMFMVIVITMMVSKPLGDLSRALAHWISGMIDKILGRFNRKTVMQGEF